MICTAVAVLNSLANTARAARGGLDRGRALLRTRIDRALDRLAFRATCSVWDAVKARFACSASSTRSDHQSSPHDSQPLKNASLRQIRVRCWFDGRLWRTVPTSCEVWQLRCTCCCDRRLFGRWLADCRLLGCWLLDAWLLTIDAWLSNDLHAHRSSCRRARFKISQPFSSRLRRAFWPRLRFLLSAKSRYSGASACGKSSALSISSKAIFKAVSPSINHHRSSNALPDGADGDAPLRRPIELDWAVASAAGSVPSTAVPSLQHFASMRPESSRTD